MAAPTYDELVTRARALEPALRERARHAEALRRIPDETVADLQAAGLWAAFRPARYGGAEIPFRGMIELGAALARLATGLASARTDAAKAVARSRQIDAGGPDGEDTGQEVRAREVAAAVLALSRFRIGVAERETSSV